MHAIAMTNLEKPTEGKTTFLEMATISLAIALSVGHIWMNTFGNVSTLIQNGFHYAGFALLCALAVPCLLYTSPSPRDLSTSRMPSSA